MIYIGIDPGYSGGIGVIQSNNLLPGSLMVEAHKMPATEMDIVDLLQSIYGYSPELNVFCYLEKAQAFPGGTKLISCPRCRTVMKTRQAQGVSSTFKFGMQYGTLKGILTALKIPFELIRPIDWQRALGCLTKGDKNVSKMKAQQLFPDLKITHAKADALLIAEFCRRMRNQGVSFSKSTIPVTEDGSESTIEG